MDLWQTTIGHIQAKEFLESGIANNRLSHALLFVGQESIGKKRLAYALAQKLSCDTNKACGSCGPCLRIAGEQSENLLELKAEKSNIKIDQVRAALQFFSLKNDEAPRFLIIDEVQKLNIQAANALLKTLEEPPPNCYIFMTAPSSLSVISTIRSRSQILRMAPLKREELQKIPQLKDLNLNLDYGGVQTSLEMHNEEVSELKSTSAQILRSFLDGDVHGAFKTVQPLAKDLDKSLKLVRIWTGVFRDAWFSKGSVNSLIHQGSDDVSQRLSSLPEASLEVISQDLLQIEHQILGNCERSLAFESFLRRSYEHIGAH